MKVESVPIASLVLDPANARKHDKKNLEAIKGSLARFDQQKPIVVGKGNVVLAGNGTLEVARQLGWVNIDIVRTDLEGAEAIAFSLADNRTSDLSIFDDEILSATLKALSDDGFPIADIGFEGFDFMEPPPDESGHGSMADKFGVPPFSVLDARQGYWQARKRYWLGLGIQSELGRGGEATASYKSQDKLDALRTGRRDG